MEDDKDEYEIFLETWKPSELLEQSTLSQNLRDPFIYQRLVNDSTGEASVERKKFESGEYKKMSDSEIDARHFEFFSSSQKNWSEGFKDYVVGKGVDEQKFDIYTSSMATKWVGKRSIRQNSLEMLAIKASVQNYYRQAFPKSAGAYVKNNVADQIAPLFQASEMAIIFEANYGLINAYLPDYIDQFDVGKGPDALDDLYVRRGVSMPSICVNLTELHYLSSYSLSIGPVEQFANMCHQRIKNTEIASIFSAPISAVQDRIVAFAPFISGMDLRQLEVVVAPPINKTPLRKDGKFGGISEFSFR